MHNCVYDNFTDFKVFGSTKKKQEPKIFRVKHYPAKLTVETLEKGVKYVQS